MTSLRIQTHSHT